MPTASPSSARIRRFSTVQLLAHLLLAVTFVVMLWTGLCLYFPVLTEVMNRPLAKQWHLYSAIALGVGLVLLVAARPRDFGKIVREADSLDADDMAWLRGGPRRLVDHKGAPDQGWWNAGQKLFTSVTMGLMVVLTVTGVLLWLGERSTAFRFGGTVDVHDLASILIVILTSGHLYLALLHPATRAATRGIVTGEVDREWARKHHARWVRDTESQSLHATKGSGPFDS